MFLCQFFWWLAKGFLGFYAVSDVSTLFWRRIMLFSFLLFRRWCNRRGCAEGISEGKAYVWRFYIQSFWYSLEQGSLKWCRNRRKCCPWKLPELRGGMSNIFEKNIHVWHMEDSYWIMICEPAISSIISVVIPYPVCAGEQKWRCRWISKVG